MSDDEFGIEFVRSFEVNNLDEYFRRDFEFLGRTFCQLCYHGNLNQAKQLLKVFERGDETIIIEDDTIISETKAEYLLSSCHSLFPRSNVSALMSAAAGGQVEVISWLLELGADVLLTNNRNRSALFYAANLEVANVLLNAGADIDDPKVLKSAFDMNCGSVLLAFLEDGASLVRSNEAISNDSSVINSYSLCLDKNRIFALLSSSNDRLHSRSFKSAHFLNRRPLRDTEYLDENLYTMDNMPTPSYDTVNILLNRGYDINCRLSLVNKALKPKEADLIRALMQGIEESCDISPDIPGIFAVMELLFVVDTTERLVPPRERNEREPMEQDKITYNLLGIACKEGFLKCFQLLLLEGINVNQCDGLNNSPLFYASFNGNAQIVARLLQAEGFIRNRSDLIYNFKLAAYRGHVEIALLLWNELIVILNETNATNETNETRETTDAVPADAVPAAPEIRRITRAVRAAGTLNNPNDVAEPTILPYSRLLEFKSFLTRAHSCCTFTSSYQFPESSDISTDEQRFISSAGDIEKDQNIYDLLITLNRSIPKSERERYRLFMTFLSLQNIPLPPLLTQNALLTTIFDHFENLIGHYVRSLGHSSLVAMVEALGSLDSTRTWLREQGIEYLTEAPSGKSGDPVLHMAARRHNFYVVEAFIIMGENLDILDEMENCALLEALEKGHEDIASSLIDAKATISFPKQCKFALITAAKNGLIKIVRQLLSERKDEIVVDSLNNSDCSALMLASLKGHVEIIDMLIKSGASLELTNVQVRSDSALSYARPSQRMNPSRIAPQIVDAGGTALIFAASAGHEQIVKLLINAGASLQATNNNGYNALQLASLWKHDKVVETLLSAGVDFNPNGPNGKQLIWQLESIPDSFRIKELLLGIKA